MDASMVRWAATAVLLARVALVLAQPAPETKKPRARPSITRADLATAFLRFEEALEANPPAKANIAAVNRDFDSLTQAFFSGDLGRAIAKLNALAESLEGGSSPEKRLADSLRVRVQPRVFLAGSSAAPTAAISSLYPLEGAPLGPLSWKLEIGGPKGAAAASVPIEISGGDGRKISLSLDAAAFAKAPVGRYEVRIVGDGFPPVAVDRWSVVAEPLGPVRERNEARLLALEGKTPELKQSLAACLARNRLLVEEPSETKTAEMLADPVSLARELEQEIAALASGKDPYRNRIGDYWRTLQVGPIQVPLRVYAPEAARGDRPMPLVIAFHGAGGDENMFMDGYGLGRLKRLADKHGFLAVTPVTGLFSNPTYLDALMETMKSLYAIDESRIFLLGHSMGAGVTEILSRARPEKIAAACCLAGGRGIQGKGAIPPTLVLGAELDPLIPASRLESMASKARAEGLPVEYRTVPDQGHTLMVTTQLEPAVEWLLKHRRNDGNRPSG